MELAPTADGELFLNPPLSWLWVNDKNESLDRGLRERAARPRLLVAMFHSELGAWPWPWNKRTEECMQGAQVTGALGKTLGRSF